MSKFKLGKKDKQIYNESFNMNRLDIPNRQKAMLGVDIGTSAIKIVQMKKNATIGGWAVEDLPDGVINQGRIEAETTLVNLIKRAMSNNKISGSDCALCISTNELIIRELTLPEMEDKQIRENIRHEITSFLPLNHEEYSIDYKVLEYIPSRDGGLGKLRIMVAAIPNKFVESYIDSLKSAGLKVSYVDVIPNAVSKVQKWLMRGRSVRDGYDNVCVIDFGANTTDVVILKDRSYFIHKTISNGGSHLTALIAERMGMDEHEAESYKKRTNFFSETEQKDINQRVKTFFDYIINDVERTIGFFHNRNNNLKIEQIFIMGGGSLLDGLRDHIKAQLGIDVSYISDELGQEYQVNRSFEENIAMLSHAIGATIREER